MSETTQTAETEPQGPPEVARGGRTGRPRPPEPTVTYIMDQIPHRYPFLLVDRILEVEPGHRALGLKNVTVNEPFFIGHFPGNPIMPGVLILEAMAQVAVFMVKSLPGHADKLALFTGIDKVRFRRPVLPGDQLIIETILARRRNDIGRVNGVARVNGEVVCEGEIMYVLAPPGYPYENGEA